MDKVSLDVDTQKLLLRKKLNYLRSNQKVYWRELDKLERSEQTWALLVFTFYEFPKDLRCLIQSYVSCCNLLERDVSTVIQQTSCTRKIALKTLRDNDSDLVRTIKRINFCDVS